MSDGYGRQGVPALRGRERHTEPRVKRHGHRREREGG